jgi:VCBS repeat-containing protein
LNVTDDDGDTDTIQKTILVSPNLPPDTPSNPYPANGSGNISLVVELSWTGGDPNWDIVTYDVYFGNTSSPDKIMSNQSGTIYNPGGDGLYTTYYWKIVAWDSHGEHTIGPTWHFTTRTNHAPIAYPDSYSIDEDTVLSVVAPGVLGNDVDSDGDPLTAVKVNNTLHGSLTLNSNGSFIYVPDQNYYGNDTFSYKAYDGFVYSNVVNVTITIHPVNDPPIFGTPTPANGSIDRPLSFTWSILINDIEGDQLSWTIQCSNGQNNSGIDETNGTKTLELSGLAYSTTYTVWVNATDSNDNTMEWFTFKTQSAAVAVVAVVVEVE